MSKYDAFVNERIDRIGTAVAAFVETDRKAAESKALALADIGQPFCEIVDHRTPEGEDPSPNTVYDEFKGKLSKVYGKTSMVNVAYPLARIREAGKLDEFIAGFKANGIKGEVNSDGTPKLNTNMMGRAAGAFLKGNYSLTTGHAKKVSGHAKSDAEKRASLMKKVVKAATVTHNGQASIDPSLSFEGWTHAELEAAQVALRAILDIMALDNATDAADIWEGVEVDA